VTQMQLILHLPRPSRLVGHIHARVRSLDVEIDIIRDVLDHYGFKLSEPPRNLPLSRRSRNVALDTSAGKLVLKRYRPEWQVTTIVYGHSVLTRLAELNFPAPRLVVTPDGDTFVSHDGQNYALFSFVRGTSYCSSYVPRAHWLKLVALAGRTLARFHRQLEGFVPTGHHHLGFESYTADRKRDRAWYIEQLNETREISQRLVRSEDKASANWLVENTDLMVEELQRLDEILRAALLPRLVVHGDYAIQNLLFQPDGTVTVLDFELARMEWRLSDLVTSLARFRHGSGVFDLECMRHFVGSYQAEYPISPDEWWYLPQVWQLRRIQRAAQSWRAYFASSGSTRQLAVARKALCESAWAQRHQDELRAMNPAHSRSRG